LLDNISCVGGATPSTKSILFYFMILINSFLVMCVAFIALLNGISDKSIGKYMIPTAIN